MKIFVLAPPIKNRPNYRDKPSMRQELVSLANVAPKTLETRAVFNNWAHRLRVDPVVSISSTNKTFLYNAYV